MPVSTTDWARSMALAAAPRSVMAGTLLSGRRPSRRERARCHTGPMARVCVFCGSSPGADPAFSAAATDLGVALAEAGHTLVYGGGAVGLMGVLADAVLAAG